jgi:hypothetical protein
MVPDLTQPDDILKEYISAVCGDLSEIALLLQNK